MNKTCLYHIQKKYSNFSKEQKNLFNSRKDKQFCTKIFKEFSLVIYRLDIANSNDTENSLIGVIDLIIDKLIILDKSEAKRSKLFVHHLMKHAALINSMTTILASHEGTEIPEKYAKKITLIVETIVIDLISVVDKTEKASGDSLDVSDDLLEELEIIYSSSNKNERRECS
ncbi:hypothetical protein M2139_001520 [Enterococcus sp. PF1-24]|uniref:hypothetical protein n=1 Tax=unclassified Enterococcus TaxID=2608891 RepID=UPI002473D3C8|nr:MULTISPECIES: hypothetical protein [unclassified Enterococcus]MDH6364489.1 hypothetical protein [Enterococcus sp. PFB1-1]MDH6401634.1 hypothetical protein [Enterococcus sp. PF1-24]